MKRFICANNIYTYYYTQANFLQMTELLERTFRKVLFIWFVDGYCCNSLLQRTLGKAGNCIHCV